VLVELVASTVPTADLARSDLGGHQPVVIYATQHKIKIRKIAAYFLSKLRYPLKEYIKESRRVEEHCIERKREPAFFVCIGHSLCFVGETKERRKKGSSSTCGQQAKDKEYKN